MFATSPASYRMTVEEAQLWDQRPFRSMLIQGWVEFDGTAFRLAQKGREAFGKLAKVRTELLLQIKAALVANDIQTAIPLMREYCGLPKDPLLDA